MAKWFNIPHGKLCGKLWILKIRGLTKTSIEMSPNCKVTLTNNHTIREDGRPCSFLWRTNLQMSITKWDDLFVKPLMIYIDSQVFAKWLTTLFSFEVLDVILHSSAAIVRWPSTLSNLEKFGIFNNYLVNTFTILT